MGFQKNEQHNQVLTLALNIVNEENVECSFDDEKDIDHNNRSEQQQLSPKEEVLLPNSSSGSFQCRSHQQVKFAKKIRIRETLCLDEYTTKEIYNCWYTAEEKNIRALKRKQLIARMEARKPPKGNNMTYRGLEDWTVRGSIRLEKQILKCVDAVMDEQDRQWKIGQDDFDQIAEISQKVSSVSKEVALKRAVGDRKAVLRVLSSREDCKSMSILISSLSTSPLQSIVIEDTIRRCRDNRNLRSSFRQSNNDDIKKRSNNHGVIVEGKRMTRGRNNQNVVHHDNRHKQRCTTTRVDSPGTLHHKAAA